MKKVLPLICVFLFAGMSYADADSVFTPLDFNSSQEVRQTAPVSAVSETPNPEAIGNGNIQNAILQLDNAQVDIRTELQSCRAKYSDIDAQYKLIKSERSALKKQVNSIEKRIKSIEKAKDKIRKNMV